MEHTGIRALTGLATIAIIAAIVAVAIGLFRGSFTESVPVTVISPRAGLVMNKDAKVKMRGVQVGKVDSIEPLPNGQARLGLAMYPSDLHLIPANVLVDITAPTVFGAKFVELVPPAEPSGHLQARQVLHVDPKNITVEINTVFKQLKEVLGTLDPTKLNETLGAIGQALSGRGEKIGQAFSDLDSFLAKFDPSLPALSRDIALSAPVFNAYADASPDLVKTVANAAKISQTFVDEQHNLDALLVSAIGLADVGNDVLSANRKGLTDVIHLLRPTTDLTNQYNKALWCGFAGLAEDAKWPPLSEPSINIVASLTWGAERYRYPTNLPKVAATGGPQCLDLPKHTFNTNAKLVVTDTGANPVVYGNQQLLLNSDLLKQLLYGPIVGPPRNSAMVGMPG
ncbi:MCE family protein [Mycobacterium fragae]|uniref:MCE family protein n=1 Tax=Mycobacterium fragae TaxID=1260918 RepID=UPI000A153EF1|nr:MCE family protein [Mycobacterium fragae]MCV7399886.1 MCE family protein [Mycobacterium fragae]